MKAWRRWMRRVGRVGAKPALVLGLVALAGFLTLPAGAATGTCLSSATVTNGSAMNCDAPTTGAREVTYVFKSVGSATTSEFSSCALRAYLPDGTTVVPANLPAGAIDYSGSIVSGGDSYWQATGHVRGLEKVRGTCTNASGASKTVTAYYYTESIPGSTNGNSAKVQFSNTSGENDVVVTAVNAVVPVKGSPNSSDPAVKTAEAGALAVHGDATAGAELVHTDGSSGGSGGTVSLDAAATDQLDLAWWGTWATAGLILVLLIAPLFVRAFRFWRE